MKDNSEYLRIFPFVEMNFSNLLIIRRTCVEMAQGTRVYVHMMVIVILFSFICPLPNPSLISPKRWMMPKHTLGPCPASFGLVMGSLFITKAEHA